MLNTTHCPSSGAPRSAQRQHFLMSLRKRLTNGIRHGLRQLNHTPDLQIQQQRDRAGDLYWLAYNPKTGKTFTSASEADMRAWIEQQYYL